jgi:hypothetical protein
MLAACSPSAIGKPASQLYSKSAPSAPPPHRLTRRLYGSPGKLFERQRSGASPRVANSASIRSDVINQTHPACTTKSKWQMPKRSIPFSNPISTALSAARCEHPFELGRRVFLAEERARRLWRGEIVGSASFCTPRSPSTNELRVKTPQARKSLTPEATISVRQYPFTQHRS